MNKKNNDFYIHPGAQAAAGLIIIVGGIITMGLLILSCYLMGMFLF